MSINSIQSEKISINNYSSEQTKNDEKIKSWQEQLNETRGKLNNLAGKNNLSSDGKKEIERQMKQKIAELNDKIRNHRMDLQKEMLGKRAEESMKEKAGSEADAAKELNTAEQRNAAARLNTAVKREAAVEKNVAETKAAAERNVAADKNAAAEKRAIDEKRTAAEKAAALDAKDKRAELKNDDRTVDKDKAADEVKAGNADNIDKSKETDDNKDISTSIDMEVMHKIIQGQSETDALAASNRTDRRIYSQKDIEKAEMRLDRSRGRDTSRREARIENIDIDVSKIGKKYFSMDN